MGFIDDFQKQALSSSDNQNNNDLNYINNSISKINQLAIKPSYGLSKYGDSSKYSKYGVTINPINTEEELNKERAKNQSALEQTGRMLAQIVENEVLLGTALGLSNLFDMAKAAITSDKMFENNSELTNYLTEIQNANKERLEIYRQNPDKSWDITDLGWWMDNLVSIGSTASLLIPSMGISKGLSFLGKALRFDKGLNKITQTTAKAINAAAKTKAIKHPNILAKTIGAGTETFNSALLSRTMENYQEGQEVFNLTKNNAFDKLNNFTDEEKAKFFENNPQYVGMSNEEIANDIAGKSAKETFLNDYWMLLMDYAQFKGISRMSKGLRNSSDSFKVWQAKENLIKNFNKDVADNVEKTGFNKYIKDRLKYTAENWKYILEKSELSEGIEEGYQGIQSDRGEEVYRKIFDPNYNARTLGSYLSDGKIWEQAFWGVAGGLVFSGLGHGLHRGSDYIKAYNYKNKAQKDNTFSETDFNRIKQGETAIQLANINAMQARFVDFQRQMATINDGKNPFQFKIDPVTGKEIFDETGKINEDLSADEIALYKQKAIDSFIKDMAIEASEAGNGDILEELINSQEFRQAYNSTSGINANEDAFENNLLNRFKDIKEMYYQTLFDVTDNLEGYKQSFDKNEVIDANEFAIKAIAKKITEDKIKVMELTDNIQRYEQEINNVNSEQTEKNIDNAIQQYKDLRLAVQLKEEFKALDKQEKELQEKLNNKIITKFGYKAQLDEINRYRNLLRKKLPVFEQILDGEKEIRQGFKDDTKHKYDTFISRFTKWYNENINDGSELNDENLPKKEILELINKQVHDEIEKSIVSANIPKTGKEYKDYYEETVTFLDKYVADRFAENNLIIENYLKNAKDLDLAYQRLIDGNTFNKKINDAAKAAKLYNVKQLQSIYEKLKKERNEEIKKDNEVETNGEKQSQEQAQQSIQSAQEVINEQAQKEEELKNIPTGEQLSQEEIDAIDAIKQQLSEEKQAAEAEKLFNDPTVLEIQKPKLSERARQLTKEEGSKAGKDYILSIINGDNGKRQTLLDKIIKLVNDELSSGEIDLGYGETKFVGNDSEKNKCIEEGFNNYLSLVKRAFDRQNDKIAKGIESVIDIKRSTTEDVQDDTELINNFRNLLKDYKEERKYQKDTINIEKFFLYLHNQGYADYILTSLLDKLNEIQDKLDINSSQLFKELKNNPYLFVNNLIARANAEKESLSSGKLRVEGTRTLNKDNKTKSDIITDVGSAIDEYRKGHGRLSFELDGTHGVRLFYISDIGNDKTEIGFNSYIIQGTNDGKYKDNNTFSIKRSAYVDKEKNVINNYGFIYEVTKDKDGYITSNVDFLFDALIDSWENKDKNRQVTELFNLINHYYYLIKDDYKTQINDISDCKKILNNELIQKLIQNKLFGFTGSIDLDNNKYIDKKATMLVRSIGKILIDGMKGIEINENAEEARASYDTWKEQLFNNYESTYKIEQDLHNGKKVQANLIAGNLEYIESTDDFSPILDYNIVKEQNADNPNISPLKSNPICVIKDNMIQVEGGRVLQNTSRRGNGFMGMLLIDNPVEPQIAWFNINAGQQVGTGNTKQDKELADNVRKEITYLLRQYSDPDVQDKIGFEELKNRFRELIGGSSVKHGRNGLFLGCDIHIGNDFIGIDYSGNKFRNGDENKVAYDIMLFRYKNSNSRNKTESHTIMTYDKNSQDYTAARKYDKEFIKLLTDNIMQHLRYNASFVMFEDTDNPNYSNNNRYFNRKDNKLHIEFTAPETTSLEYDSFTDYVIAHNAFKLDIAKSDNGNFIQNGTKEDSNRTMSLLVEIDNETLPVEKQVNAGVNTALQETLSKSNSETPLNVNQALLDSGRTAEQINVARNNTYGIDLLEQEVYVDQTDKNPENAKHNDDTGKITITAAGVNKVITKRGVIRTVNGVEYGHKDLMQLLLHENLHDRIQNLHTFDRRDVVDNLLKIYNEFVRSVNENKDKKLIDWINDYFNFDKFVKDNHLENKSKSYQEKRFAEDWLVESLTQKPIIDYLQSHDYKGEQLDIKNLKPKAKTIWDKIVEILLKLFGLERKLDTNKNSILANELKILHDIKSSKPKKQKLTSKQLTNPNQTSLLDNEDFMFDNTKSKESEEIKVEPVPEVNIDFSNMVIDESEVEEVKTVNNNQSKVDEVNIELQDTPIIGTFEYSTTEDVQESDKSVEELRVETVKDDVVLNTKNTQVVSDMNSYLESYPPQDKLNIAKCIESGDFKYIC